MSANVLLSNLFGKVWKIFRFFLLIGLAYTLLFPLLTLLSTSFRSAKDVLDPSVVWVPRDFTLENFKEAAGAMEYLSSLGNTFMIGGVSSLIQIMSCALIGYGFARFKFKGRGILFALVLFTIIVPPQTVTIPQYVFNQFFSVPFIGGNTAYLKLIPIQTNILDTSIQFYIPAALGVGIRSGLYIYIFRQFFRGIPRELEEAATIDGCGAFSTFMKIMIPNAGAAFLTVFLLSLVWYWNDYFSTFLFMGSRTTLATALADLKMNLKALGVNYLDPFEVLARMQAGCLLMIFPLLVMYAFLQRYFTESIERTGIVG